MPNTSYGITDPQEPATRANATSVLGSDPQVPLPAPLRLAAQSGGTYGGNLGSYAPALSAMLGNLFQKGASGTQNTDPQVPLPAPRPGPGGVPVPRPNAGVYPSLAEMFLKRTMGAPWYGQSQSPIPIPPPNWLNRIQSNPALLQAIFNTPELMQIFGPFLQANTPPTYPPITY